MPSRRHRSYSIVHYYSLTAALRAPSGSLALNLGSARVGHKNEVPPVTSGGTHTTIAGLPVAGSTAIATIATTATTVSHFFGFAAAAAIGTAGRRREAFCAEKFLFPFGEGELTVAIGANECRIGHRTNPFLSMFHLGQGSPVGGAKGLSASPPIPKMIAHSNRFRPCRQILTNRGRQNATWHAYRKIGLNVRSCIQILCGEIAERFFVWWGLSVRSAIHDR